MVVFSKFLNNKENILSYEIYFNKNINLKKFKIPELKEIAKNNKLHISGTKPVLIERIETHFLRCKNACIIQKYLRGHFVRLSYKLRGPAFLKRNLCVNETDFYTLEPLNEIPNEHFYSYKDNYDFIYGFSIISLMTLFKKKNNEFYNPYNRESINVEIINNILKLTKLTEIIYYNKKTIKSKNNKINTNTENIITNNILNSRSNRTEIIEKINILRNKPIQLRIENLFIEIDILGNYTQSYWFTNLQKNDYIRLYQYLHFIWYNSGILSYNVKKEISPFFDPFINGLRNNTHNYFYNSTIEDIREYCCTIMENIVFGGIDIEYRKLGVLHILSALTMVSEPARENMPWLFDSLNSIIFS